MSFRDTIRTCSIFMGEVVTFGMAFLFLSVIGNGMIRGAHGYTVRECATVDSTNNAQTCCQCPQPAQHWAGYHCDALAVEAEKTWPAPFATCQVEVVHTCDVPNAGNVPVVYTFEDLKTNSINTYHMLAKEYAVTLLNTATGLDPDLCVDYSNLVEYVASPTNPDIQEQVNFKTDVMDRASVLLTVHCASKSFDSIYTTSEQQEITWLTSLLHGFNTGTMFMGDSACTIGGDPDTSYGSDTIGPDTHCVSAHGECTLSAQEWKDLSCSLTVPGKGDTTNCPRWPAPYSENQFLCGEHESYVELLSTSDDIWLQLASQYVAASLNVASGACVTGTIRDIMNVALAELHVDCPCSDSQLLGQTGCVHNAVDDGSTRALNIYQPLITALEEYNSGTSGPGSCMERKLSNFAPANVWPETALEAVQTETRSNGFCCSGGCTRSYSYYLSHSCHSWQVGSKHREAWPGAPDLSCSTIPNMEDNISLCGTPRYSILKEYTTERGVDEQDAWTMLAQAVIVAQLNKDAGACTEHVMTKYSTQQDPWVRLTLNQVIKHGKSLLTSHCDMVGTVRYDTVIGAEMHALRVVLDDFIRGSYGPGRCFPDASGSSGCNGVRLDDSESTSLLVGSLPTTVNDGLQQPIQCELEQDSTCCSLTADYWSRHNADENAPQNVHAWPMLLDMVTCDYTDDVCTHQRPINAAGSLQKDAMARAMAQILRVNPMRLAPAKIVGANRGLQEHASYCSANISGTFTNTDRPVETRMASLLRLVRSTSETEMKENYSMAQRKWIRLANAFTASMLNVRRMTDRECHDSPATLMTRIGDLEGADRRYLLNTDYLEQCLFGACDASQSNVHDSIPSLPSHTLCEQGFFSVVNAIESFNNGRLATDHSMAYDSEHGHCFKLEPPSIHCDSGTNDRYCSCVHDRLYYQSHYQGHDMHNMRIPWPTVSTSTEDLAVPFPEVILSNEGISLPIHTEDFTALTCSTRYNMEGVTWFDILMESPPNGLEGDAYSQLMTQLIPAWLNIFNGACAPSDVVEVLLEATHLIDNMIQNEDNIMCVSNQLGTRIPVDPGSVKGVIMMSATRVLRSFNEGYQGSQSCVDLCVGVNAPDCGDHGTCQPLTGKCTCDSGYTGETCSYSECGGHGIQATSGGGCSCFPGWGGPTCQTCAGPSTARGHVYICMPCIQEVCGAPGEYLLQHFHASNATALLTGKHKLPGYASLDKPLRPGTAGLDCSCNGVSEETNKLTRGTQEVATRKIHSHRQRIAADFSTEYKRRSSNREMRSRDISSVLSNMNVRMSSIPRDPRGWHLGEINGRNRVMTTRDLCDTASEETTIEDFLLFCMQDLTNLQTSLEETTSMCDMSISLCENAIEENTAVTHVDLHSQLADDNNEQRALSISTLAVASAILFVLFFTIIVLLLIWAGVRLRKSSSPQGRMQPSSMYSGYLRQY